MGLGTCIKEHKFIFCFSIIFIFKIILAGLFSSDYQDKLFIPFVTGWLEHGGNPYDYFADKVNWFPYPPLMLFIESIGGKLLLIFGENIFLRNLFFKIPLFIFDCLCFFFLIKLFSNKKIQITVIYFCSPILIYAVYMHGQLDIIPTALLIGSIYYLLSQDKSHNLISSLFFATALCTKFHIFAILPIFCMFKAKQSGWKKAFFYELGIPFLIAILVILPFWCDGFFHNIVMNKEQSVLTKVVFNFNSVQVYIPILAILLIYFRMFVIARMNKSLFFGFSAILLAVFLILVPPMPGWYIWWLPFFVIFYIDIQSDRSINFFIFSLFSALYILYYIFIHDTVLIDLSFLGKDLDFIKSKNTTLCNFAFTSLFAVHLYLIYYIYCVALHGNNLYCRGNVPFIIGISGDSGSGKSTLVKIINTILGNQQVLTLECDGDHRWERGSHNWHTYTHLNPLANYLYRQAKDVSLLRAGKTIFRREYNHYIGQFDKPHKVFPRPFILVTGLHALYLPQLRQQEDLKIYMDIDEKLRRFWKIQRDVYERGHSLQDVQSQIEMRRDDFYKYIEPQRKNADLLISYFDKNLDDYSIKEYNPHLSLKISVLNNINFEPLILILSKYGISISYEFSEDMVYQTIIFESENFEKNTIPATEVARSVVPELESILKQPLITRNNMWTIIGIVILMMISNVIN